MNKICVIGLGRFGFALAERLSADGLEVLAVDTKQEVIEHIKDKVTLAVRADGTDVDVLRSLGVETMDLVVVAIGADFEATQLTQMAARELSGPRVYVRADDHTRKKIIRALGAHEVIMPEEEAAIRLAKNLSSLSLTEAVELDRTHSMIQLSVPHKVIGQTVGVLKLRDKYHLNIVAIRSRPTATMIMTRDSIEEGSHSPEHEAISIPTSETKIHPGDTLIIVGKNTDIDHFVRDND